MSKPPEPAEPTPDQRAAHHFLAELRTRIAIQPLPYQAGIEESALKSLWQLFGHARDAIQKYPACDDFAHRVANMLNVHVRPVTAKWHRAQAEGRLASRDGADEFREELEDLRNKLWDFANELHVLAYASPLTDQPTPAMMSPEAVDQCFHPIPFGIVPEEKLISASTADKINDKERQAVHARRRTYRVAATDGHDAIGLGLSGGGIRSATFCLGAIQVLAQHDLLKEVDFLSTVSGGGYTGAFLSSRLGNGEAHSDVAYPDGPDPHAVRHLRHNAKYLSGSDLKERWSMAISVLAGMVLNWSGLLALLALVAVCGKFYEQQFGIPPWQTLVAWSTAATGVALLIYGWRLASDGHDKHWPGRLLGSLAAVTALLGLCWFVEGGRAFVTNTLASNWKGITVGASLLAAAPSILRFVPILRTPLVQRTALKIILVLASIGMPVAALTGFFLLLNMGWQSLVCIFVVAVLGALALNINLTGPHRLYRSHLARTFVENDLLDTAPRPLQELNRASTAPYHLINATVNLPSSTSPILRDRKGDFFLFSKYWCGAPATGYLPTENWLIRGAQPDLATAMAISGAAFAPHMGLASMPTLQALLTFFNVRLGFWIRNPGRPATTFDRPGLGYLLREMTGAGMSEDKPWLNLSDGGHIENMAVYELLRRRCKFIISIDGEADPQSSFHGHLTLARHAQIDLGVRIDSTLEDLRPSPGSKHSKTHYMFCRIHYPDRSIGLLLYIKLSTTGNEAEMIKRYRLTHPDFPHQSTLDQFFDEEQFEAYRQLGAHVMTGLFSKSLLGDIEPADIPEWFRGLAGSLLEPARETARAQTKDGMATSSP